MHYQIPKQLKSEIKITRSLYLRDIAIVFVVMVLVWLFDSQVHTALKIPYYIVSVVITLFLVVPSRHNPQKRNYHSIYFSLIRNRVIYSSFDIDNPKNEVTE